MRRGVVILTFLALATGSADGQVLPIAAFSDSSAFVATNPTLQASLQRIARQSVLWREAAEQIHKIGRRVVVVTPDQVSVASGEGWGDVFGGGVLAEVAPVVRADESIDLAVVIVNLSLLEEQHRDRHLPPIDFERDLDRILIHEIYSHAVPYLLAGHVSGRCADPQPRQRPADACSLKRENAIRSELGLGRRRGYGLDDLSFTRRSRY